MTGPTLDNQTAQVVDDIINAWMSGGEKAVEVYLTALDPAFLAIPLVQLLLDDGVEYFGKILDVFIMKFATGAVIDAQTNGEKSAAVTAAAALQYAIAGGKPDEIQKAIQAAGKAYAALGNWDGVAKLP